MSTANSEDLSYLDTGIDLNFSLKEIASDHRGVIAVALLLGLTACGESLSEYRPESVNQNAIPAADFLWAWGKQIGVGAVLGLVNGIFAVKTCLNNRQDETLTRQKIGMYTDLTAKLAEAGASEPARVMHKEAKRLINQITPAGMFGFIIKETAEGAGAGLVISAALRSVDLAINYGGSAIDAATLATMSALMLIKAIKK